jgi:hypothetical protein
MRDTHKHEAKHLTFPDLSVPYENRVAKPTSPELQVKNYMHVYKSPATGTGSQQTSILDGPSFQPYKVGSNITVIH